jgi:hypothetical protein
MILMDLIRRTFISLAALLVFGFYIINTDASAASLIPMQVPPSPFKKFLSRRWMS